MLRQQNNKRVSAIIVAAGASTRFPGNKLLIELDNKPIIYWSVTKIVGSDVKKTIVVLGKDAPRILQALITHLSPLELNKIAFVYNPDYMNGEMSDSIKRGLSLIETNNDILIHPGDVPCLSTWSVKKVLLQHIEKKPLITVACYKGRYSHPIIFSYRLRKELEKIGKETRGLKGLIEKHREQILCVETDDPGTLRDIDEPEDFFECKKIFFKNRDKRGEK